MRAEFDAEMARRGDPPHRPVQIQVGGNVDRRDDEAGSNG
jgi:hypothetical protein